jgi:hypothetical protein
MVPYDGKEYDVYRGPSIRDRLETLAKTSQLVASNVIRRAKVLKSSPFEGLILKATWPNNLPVPKDMVEELIRHSIPAFKYVRWVFLMKVYIALIYEQYCVASR